MKRIYLILVSLYFGLTTIKAQTAYGNNPPLGEKSITRAMDSLGGWTTHTNAKYAAGL